MAVPRRRGNSLIGGGPARIIGTMRIYTKTGDAGETALFGGGRVPKSHARVEAYGDVDELNAVIGVALAAGADPIVRRGLEPVQHDLFALGAHLATPADTRGRRPELPAPPLARIAEMEHWMDASEEHLPELRAFILPGGSPAAAALHHARTVCRRAERRVVALAATDEVPDWLLSYLNRLADLLFVMARVQNARDGRGDVQWAPER